MRFYRLEVSADDGQPMIREDFLDLNKALDAIIDRVNVGHFADLTLYEVRGESMFHYSNPRTPPE